jgi:hypothetical protein
MTYSVYFGANNKPEVSVAKAATANAALAFIDGLQREDQEIRLISSPQEGEIGIEMLRVLAKEEEEETPVFGRRGDSRRPPRAI